MNVTCDNYFASINLLLKLKEMKFNLLGTMKSNRKEITKELLPKKTRQPESSIFGFRSRRNLFHIAQSKTFIMFLSFFQTTRKIKDLEKIDRNRIKFTSKFNLQLSSWVSFLIPDLQFYFYPALQQDFKACRFLRNTKVCKNSTRLSLGSQNMLYQAAQ